MRILVLTLAILLTQSVPLRADHYDVFLIGGQSNCDGRGKVAELTGPLAKWKQPQADVLITYSCSKLRGPILTSGGFVPLQPGYSVAPGSNKAKGLPSGTFGPEVSFGRGMADRLKGRKIALIKYTEGGTSLSKDWNPDVKDRMYSAFVDFTKKSLRELTDKGHTYTVRGMIWHQGESDANLSAEVYQKMLTAFIARVRQDLAVPGIVFGIGEVYDNGKRDSIRTAQKATAAQASSAYFVSSEKLNTFDKGVHFDAASQIELGERFAAGMVQALSTAP
ncbi:MAG: sialate O-acetylesterase [Bacteroidales bacterium]|nr:sialate O-acetylesterase [Bacteroidales bacterium]